MSDEQMSSTIPKLLETMSQRLQIPRAALAYGIDTRELRHNAFLHFLLGSLAPDSFKRALLRSLFAAVIAKDRETDKWQSLASATIESIRPRYNVSGRKGRPDEVIECETTRGRFVIVVEMKIKAGEGPEQLDGYVQDESVKAENANATVLGVLLRIPGRDQLPVASEYPVITGADYRGCLADVTSTLYDAEHQFKWLVEDYLSTLDFLELTDQVIVEHGDSFRQLPKGGAVLLNDWYEENWRWVQLRIMREVVARLKQSLGRWCGGAYASTDGAAADFSLETLLDVRSSTDGAGMYCTWKLDNGFQVRAMTRDYGNKPTPRSRTIMVSLCEQARIALKTRFKEVRAEGSVHGNSCMVARFVNPTYAVNVIVRELSNRLAEVEPVLVDVVQSFQPRDN